MKIVTKGDNTKLDSDTTNVTIKSSSCSSTGNRRQGKITGTTALMEYKKPDAKQLDCMHGPETEVEAGEYNVRIAATDTDFAGVLVTVTFAAADIDLCTTAGINSGNSKYSGKVNIVD